MQTILAPGRGMIHPIFMVFGVKYYRRRFQLLY